MSLTEELVMTNQEEWDKREEKSKRRFLVPTYTIKNQYDKTILVAAYYISAKGSNGIRPNVEVPSHLK